MKTNMLSGIAKNLSLDMCINQHLQHLFGGETDKGVRKLNPKAANPSDGPPQAKKI